MKIAKIIGCTLIMATLSVLALVSCNSADGTTSATTTTTETATTTISATTTENGAFNDDMKIPYETDYSLNDGADSVEREGDHSDSPYFKAPDFYNMKSSGSLVILEKFKTQQQSTEWSCGLTSLYMMLYHYDLAGEHDEGTLALLRPGKEKLGGGTSLGQMIGVLESVLADNDEYEIISTRDYLNDEGEPEFYLSDLKELISNGIAVAIGWNDWGGHWQVVIGYDDMGTPDYEGDDVIIVADPYDTTDHCQDGYGIYSAERFIYNFSFYNFFDEENESCFVYIQEK